MAIFLNGLELRAGSLVFLRDGRRLMVERVSMLMGDQAVIAASADADTRIIPVADIKSVLNPVSFPTLSIAKDVFEPMNEATEGPDGEGPMAEALFDVLVGDLCEAAALLPHEFERAMTVIILELAGCSR